MTLKKKVDIIQIMTLYYTIWCLLTVCGGWFSVSIISCEGETKETCTFYLTYVLERLRQLGPFPKPEELDSLLPWAEDLPEEIKTKTKPKK